MTTIAHGWTVKRTYPRDCPTVRYQRVRVRPIEHWTAEDIRALRRTLNVTQAQMAEMLGVNRVSLVRWEEGKSEIERTSILRLLSLLRERPELFFWEAR